MRKLILSSLIPALVFSAVAQSHSLSQDTSPPPLSLTAEQIKSIQTNQTYTYVRCWYRISNNHEKPLTNYQWARNNDGDYYHLPGYWWSSFSGKNMFYTDVPQQEILTKCEESLGLSKSEHDIRFFAADTKASYNQEIWSNDLKIPTNINRLVAFGDSLSDTGNIFNASMWRFPNPESWFVGHFSNGSVWTEYLADALGIEMNNWSIGGAAGSTQYLILSGVVKQVDSYITYMKLAKHYDPSKTLVTLEFGINDFILYGRSVKEVESDMSQVLTRLQQAGVKNVLIMILPDPTKAPQFARSSQEQKQIIANKIKQFNQFVMRQVEYYSAQGMILLPFNADILFEQLIKNPEDFNFINSKDACLQLDSTSPANFYLSPQPLRPACQQEGADKFVFWDILHPTTATHKLFADEVYPLVIDYFDFARSP